MKPVALAPLGVSALLALTAAVLPGAAVAEPVAHHNMPANCRGEASSKFGVNPRYIESGEVESTKHGFRVVGSYEAAGGARVGFRCRYDPAGEFKEVLPLDHGGNRPSQVQISSCNDKMLGTGKILETTPLKPGAFELIMAFPDGNFVCDVEANGTVTYFEKLR